MAQELGVAPERIYKWQAEFVRHGDASFDFDLPPSHLGIVRANLTLLSACTVFLKNKQIMYEFIDCNWSHYTVGRMVHALRISPRSYYDYKKVSTDTGKFTVMTSKGESRGSMPVPTVVMAQADIRSEGYPVSANTVSKYMKCMGLRSQLSRKCRNVNYPEYTFRISPNLLNRRSSPDAPGKV